MTFLLDQMCYVAIVSYDVPIDSQPLVSGQPKVFRQYHRTRIVDTKWQKRRKIFILTKDTEPDYQLRPSIFYTLVLFTLTVLFMISFFLLNLIQYYDKLEVYY